MEYLFTQTPLAFFVQDLWRDEAFSFFMASQSIGEIIRTTAADFSPPLYYLVLHYWMQMLGTSEVAMRSLSLGFHLLTCYVLVQILIHVFRFSFARALIYFPLILTAPFLLFYGFEARMYAMVAFFVTFSYFALWKKQFILYVIAITLAMYTQYLSVAIFLLQATTFIGYQLWSRREMISNLFSQKQRFSHYVEVLFSWFVKPSLPFLISALCYVPWIVIMLNSRSGSGEDFWVIQPPVADILYLPLVLFTGYERIFGEYYHEKAGYVWLHTRLLIFISIALLLPLLAKSFSFVQSQLKMKDRIRKEVLSKDARLISVYLWAFALPIALYLLSFVTTPLYHPRYFIMAAPGFLLLIVLSLDKCVRMSEIWIMKYFPSQLTHTMLAKILPLLLPSIVVLGMLLSVQDFQALNLKYRSKRLLSPLYTEIGKLRKPGEPVLVTNELDYHLALYYIGKENIYIMHKTYAEIPSYVGKVLIPRSAFVNAPPSYPKRSYILHYNSYDTYSEL